MTGITIRENKLTICDEELEFGAPIKKYIQYDDYLVLLLKITGEDYQNKHRNVIAVNYDGSIRWKVPRRPQPGPQSYSGLFTKHDGELWVYNTSGMQYQIDPGTGEIVDREWKK